MLSSGVEVITTKEKYLAKALIGADGVNSRVAKFANLRRGWKSHEVGIAIEATLPLINSIDEDVIQIHFRDVSFGYGWVFPKKDTVSIGLGCIGTKSWNLKERFFKFVHDNFTKSKNFKIHAHLIPLGGSKGRANIFWDRILLAGDSAGFADPLTGEGIYYAMISGEMAAYTIHEAIQKRDFGKNFLRKYWERCENMFWKDMRIAFYVSRMFYTHINFIESLLTKDKTIANYFLQLISGKISYKDLMLRGIGKGFKFLPRYLFQRLKNV